jgi:hypothetical protein
MPNRLAATTFVFINARVSAIIEISADRFRNAPVAQLDRASGYEPEGREFESLRAHHLSKDLASVDVGAIGRDSKPSPAF